MSFLNSIEKKSKKFENPFTHWELNEPLTEEQINEIINADIANPIEHNLNYDGTRAIDGGEGEFRTGISHGGKAIKFRCFINKDNSNDSDEWALKNGYISIVPIQYDLTNYSVLKDLRNWNF